LVALVDDHCDPDAGLAQVLTEQVAASLVQRGVLCANCWQPLQDAAFLLWSAAPSLLRVATEKWKKIWKIVEKIISRHSCQDLQILIRRFVVH